MLGGDNTRVGLALRDAHYHRGYHLKTLLYSVLRSTRLRSARGRGGLPGRVFSIALTTGASK